MRKTKICAFTAAAALAVTVVQPMTAFAAGWTYGMPGNCQSKIMIGEAKGLNVQELLENLQQGCEVHGLPGNGNQNCKVQGNWNPGNGSGCKLQNPADFQVKVIR